MDIKRKNSHKMSFYSALQDLLDNYIKSTDSVPSFQPEF